METDNLQLLHLAGRNIISHAPVYAADGESLFIISDNIIQVYSPLTGELVRQLVGAKDDLLAMEVELHSPDVLIACTKKGEVLRWLWRSGELQHRQQLQLPSGVVLHTFNLLDLYKVSEAPCAFITYKATNSPVQWQVVDSKSGRHHQAPTTIYLKTAVPLVAVGSYFKYLVVTQGFYIYFINYKTWQWTRLKNALKVPVTAVRVHPKEELVATGDEEGRIFLWRQFMNQPMVHTSLYHWHHTSVTSIAFSAAGASFYSSGEESVLVKWSVDNPEQRRFLPRLSEAIRYIVVNADNTQVAVSTADNAVQFVGGSDNQLKHTLQQFTYIVDDKTGKCKFPMGLRLNPRTNTLVLNGRIGHLQFYSAYSKSMLYNMDITMQNQRSMEKGHILYYIRVTKAAFNIDWIATGEEFNDEEHLPEIRLKFWQYQEESQTYALNTNIEMPHERGFVAIEFSSTQRDSELMCATAGVDNYVKLWTPDESTNIYMQGKVWSCVGRVNYKDLPLKCVSFSQDASLLAAGFGNTVCLFRTDDMTLKAALTPSDGLDGGAVKAYVYTNLNTAYRKDTKGKANRAKADRVLELFRRFIYCGDEALIDEMKRNMAEKDGIKFANDEDECEENSFVITTCPRKKRKPGIEGLKQSLNDQQKQHIYKHVMEMEELNLAQKLLIFQKLDIHCEVHTDMASQIEEYIHSTVAADAAETRLRMLQERMNSVNCRARYRAKYRLHQYIERNRRRELEELQKLDSISHTLRLPGEPPKAKTDNKNHASRQDDLDDGEPPKAKAENKNHASQRDSLIDATKNILDLPNVQPFAQINHIQFAAGERRHYLVACNESRVMVWNLLTLRLQFVYKLSVEHLTYDPKTNIFAAFSKNNELYVLQPHIPVPLYAHRNIPKIHGAVWLPRRHPKDRSIHLDWQAQSTLYFLTQQQEVMYLGSSEELASEAPPPVALAASAEQTSNQRYSTFGTFATKQISERKSDAKLYNDVGGPVVIGNTGKMAVKTLTEMSTHTMAPLTLLCAGFLKSLTFAAESSPAASTKSKKRQRDGSNAQTDGYDADGDARMNGHASESSTSDEENDSDEDVEDVDGATATTATTTVEKRKALLAKSEKVGKDFDKQPEEKRPLTETELKVIAEATRKLELEGF